MLNPSIHNRKHNNDRKYYYGWHLLYPDAIAVVGQDFEKVNYHTF
ncbi:hypothetical protein [Nostoc commune]|nr:hypothetical protein [Nostoc commune]